MKRHRPITTTNLPVPMQVRKPLYSRPAWTRSYAACCRWPCSITGVGL